MKNLGGKGLVIWAVICLVGLLILAAIVGVADDEEDAGNGNGATGTHLVRAGDLA